ncbi:MAG TPA: hypothetical protein VLN90_00960 [Thioalkalivibrio sp.]|nr:hypothetical protein [Thioalkalivibrio sp.]
MLGVIAVAGMILPVAGAAMGAMPLAGIMTFVASKVLRVRSRAVVAMAHVLIMSALLCG